MRPLASYSHFPSCGTCRLATNICSSPPPSQAHMRTSLWQQLTRRTRTVIAKGQAHSRGRLLPATLGGPEMLDRFYVPMTKPEDIIPHLVKRERHWKSEHSAQELALAWTVSGMPDLVRTVLETCNELAPIELIDGTFEKKVHLRTPGRNSQTDLMLIAAFGGELGIIAVEGKVEEPFGDLVSDWNDHSKGKGKST